MAMPTAAPGTRGISDGYVVVKMPDHPKANKGWVFEHRVVAERALGKPLPAGAQVHHINGDKADNRPCNLVICQDWDYHALLHKRQRALDDSGNADFERCSFCLRYADPKEMVACLRTGKQGVRYHHAECNKLHARAYYARKRAERKAAS